MMKKSWQQITYFFEHGDLTPFAVVVSVAHYIPVLTAHGENFVVAALVGTLIDLLHFRTIRKAVNDKRWFDVALALTTTAGATAYHLRYYNGDWLLAVPIPFAIAILAYHASGKSDETESIDYASQLKAAATENERLTIQIQGLEDGCNQYRLNDRRWKAMESLMKPEVYQSLLVFIDEQSMDAAVSNGLKKRNIQNRLTSWSR